MDVFTQSYTVMISCCKRSHTTSGPSQQSDPPSGVTNSLDDGDSRKLMKYDSGKDPAYIDTEIKLCITIT